MHVSLLDPRPFEPPPLLSGPHIQTLLGKALRPRASPELSHIRIELPDGDFVDAVESPLCGTSNRPIVLVLHGLEGSALRRYMLVTYRALIRHGLAPVGLSFRGCSGEPNRLARAYHSGDTADLSATVAWLRRRYPERPLGIVGFSLGGNVLLKYLGERPGADAGAAAAVAISVPFDLAAGSRELERPGPYRVYRGYFLRSLRRKVAEKRALIRGLADVEAALNAKTLREFDDALTAPLHGFQNAATYYEESSSAGFLASIETPTLVIHAMDDPFLPAGSIPHGSFASNPALETLLPGHGGHVGFVSSSGTAGRFWAEDEAARYLRRALCS